MASNTDYAALQLKAFKDANANQKDGKLTLLSGRGVADKTNSLSAGPRGPLLLQDLHYIEEMAHFDRERIPERVVHAKGGGAFGYFEVTSTEIAKYTRAKVFEKVGKRTPVAARFSTVAGENGSSDTVRDPRGFALKFYTDDGVWDLVGNNTPIFFLRDPILFPSFIRSQKRNPATHLRDSNAFWDFITLREETTHQVSFLFSDRGIPDGFRHMNGYGSHTFKLVNEANEAFYTKFHFKTQQGIKNLDVETAGKLASEDPDYAIRDLYNAIVARNFPKWTLYVQIMTYEQAAKFKFNPFDLTKVWPHDEYPLIEVGNLVLDRNPDNYFAQIEQLAFSPANFVNGIEASPDKMLQGRLFAYDDTHRHRLGANFHQLPPNCPARNGGCPVTGAVTYRDGPYVFSDNGGGAPNYWPNSYSKLQLDASQADHVDKVSGDVDRFDTSNDDNYEQITNFWTKVLKPEERDRLARNIAGHLKNAEQFLQERAVRNFDKVHKELGNKLRMYLDVFPNSK